MPLATAQEILHMPGLISAVDILLDAGVDKAAVETDLMENVTGSLDLHQLEFNAFEIKTIKLQRESSGEQ